MRFFLTLALGFFSSLGFARSADEIIGDMNRTCDHTDAVCASGFVIKAVQELQMGGAEKCPDGTLAIDSFCFALADEGHKTCDSACKNVQSVYDPNGRFVTPQQCQQLFSIRGDTARNQEPQIWNDEGANCSERKTVRDSVYKYYGGGGQSGTNLVAYDRTDSMSIQGCTCKKVPK
jgi:hypothetical protein